MITQTIATDTSFLDTQALTPAWFAQFGWRPGPGRCWQRHTSFGQAHLRPVAESANWTHFVLEGAALYQPTVGTYLRRQQNLSGPFKFVRGYDGSIVCRSDVPRNVDTYNETIADHRDITRSIWMWQWLRQATDLLDRQSTVTAPEFNPSAVAQWLEECGHTATCDGAQVWVHMSLAGCFAQIRCERLAPSGIHLSADFLSLEKLPPRVQRAMLRFVAEANDRLPLARFVVSDTCPSHLSCEISLGSAMIPGTWFLVALEAMEAAVAHTVRELLALRDPTLARRYLAVSTASLPVRAERTL